MELPSAAWAGGRKRDRPRAGAARRQANQPRLRPARQPRARAKTETTRHQKSRPRIPTSWHILSALERIGDAAEPIPVHFGLLAGGKTGIRAWIEKVIVQLKSLGLAAVLID